jgi:hypothetical protein
VWHTLCKHNKHVVTRKRPFVDAELEQIVAALLAYLSAHPSAADTAEGIAEWWLGGLEGSVTKVAVEQALQRLIDEGVVASKRIANGTVIYALNNKK